MLAFQLQKRASDLQKKGVYEHFQEISRPPSSTVTLTRFLHFYAPFFGTKGLTNTIENGSLRFNVYEKENHFISYGEINEDEYIIQTQNIEDAILVIGGLKKANENN